MLLRYSKNPLAITQVWKMRIELTSRYIFQLYFFLLIFTVLQTLPAIIWGEWTVDYGLTFLGQPTKLT